MGETLLDCGVVAEMNDKDRLSAGDAAAFLDGTLSGDELARVQSMLSDDPSARREIAEAARIIASAPVNKGLPIRWLAVSALAALAATALIVVQPGKISVDATQVARERRAIEGPSDRITLVTPAGGQRIEGTDVTLTWRAVDGAAYRVVVSGAAGQILLEKNTGDTSIVVPLDVLRGSIGVLYWSVDALAPDGSSLTSGVREFSIAPAR